MSSADRVGITLVLLVGVTAALGVAAQPQTTRYRLVESWPELPSSMNGGEWGETIGVDRDREGNIWVLHRCFATRPAGAATCVGRDGVPPILKFDPSGHLLDSWGEGRLAFPHGFTPIATEMSGRPTPTGPRRCSGCRREGGGIRSSSSVHLVSS